MNSYSTISIEQALNPSKNKIFTVATRKICFEFKFCSLHFI